MKPKLVGDGPILAVDDDPVDREILQRFFERSDISRVYKLEPITSGQELLEHMARVEAGEVPMPSIILLDINMPAMDGFEVLRAVRAKPAFQTIPTVVFVSNSDNPRDVARAIQLGAAFTEKFSNSRDGIEFFNGLAA